MRKLSTRPPAMEVEQGFEGNRLAAQVQEQAYDQVLAAARPATIRALTADLDGANGEQRIVAKGVAA